MGEGVHGGAWGVLFYSYDFRINKLIKETRKVIVEVHSLLFIYQKGLPKESCTTQASISQNQSLLGNEHKSLENRVQILDWDFTA